MEMRQENKKLRDYLSEKIEMNGENFSRKSRSRKMCIPLEVKVREFVLYDMTCLLTLYMHVIT